MSERAGRAKAAARPARGVAEKAGARIREHRLDNGLRVLIAERHLDPVVAVMVWYRAGARNETEREAGVSHFLEHMMFKGSDAYGKGEVDRLTTLLGGTNNAFTSTDHTAYWFELAADRWETALDIEADRMRRLTLDATEFEAEKAVVLEELAMGEDDPWRTLGQEMQVVLFSRHPYRRPIIGYPDTLTALSVADMRGYYERFYHPGNATVVICGDVVAKRALEAVRERFGAIPAGPGPAEADAFRPADPEPKGERRFTTTWPDRARRVCMGWRTVPVAHPDDYALDLLSVVLSTGRLSRLYRDLIVDRGLATSISTHNDTRVDDGVFWLYGEATQDTAPVELETAIDGHLALLADELVSAAELKRAKALLLSAEAYHSETVSDLAEDLGEFACDADWRLAVEGAQRHQKVTATELRDCARRLLGRDRRVVGWCLPRAEREGATAALGREERSARPARRKAAKPARRKAAKPARRETAKPAARTGGKESEAPRAGGSSKKTAPAKRVAKKKGKRITRRTRGATSEKKPRKRGRA